MRDFFTKHDGTNKGYTQEEAEVKKAKVDEAHGVGTSKSKWAPSKIEADPRGGFLVVISTL